MRKSLNRCQSAIDQYRKKNPQYQDSKIQTETNVINTENEDKQLVMNNKKAPNRKCKII